MNKTVSARLRPALAFAPQPFEQMIRLIGEGAHVADAHIEEMPRIICGVRKTATDRFRRLDDNDVASVEKARARCTAARTPVAPPPTMAMRMVSAI